MSMIDVILGERSRLYGVVDRVGSIGDYAIVLLLVGNNNSYRVYGTNKDDKVNSHLNLTEKGDSVSLLLRENEFYISDDFFTNHTLNERLKTKPT